MARTISLSALRTAVALQGDFTISASGRYSPTSLNFYINASIQRFRERISNEGMTHYLVSTTSTVSSGATSPYSFKTLDLSAVTPAVVRVYGVDLTVNNIVKTLAHRPFQERNDYGAPSITGEPMAWAMFGTTNVALMPAPNQSYSVTTWYLPLLADLSADGDTFDGVAGWENYIIWDCVCRLIARDQYQAAYQQAVQLRDEIIQDILRGATKVTSAGGAIVGRDTLRAGGFGRRAFAGPVVSGGSGLPPDGSVTNAMLASAPEATIKGRARGAGAGSPTDLVPAQAAAIVAVYSGGAAGLVPTGAGSTTLFLREDATWAAPSVGGSVSGVALSQLQNINPDRVLGRSTAGTGAIEQLRGQQVASMIGVFTGTMHGLAPYPSGGFGGGLFLRDDATWAAPAGGVSSGIANSQLIPFPPLTVLGNPASASGTADYLTRGQVASLLPLFGTASGSTRGLVYSPTAGIANRFLRDDGSFQGIPSFIPTGLTLAQFAAIPETTILGRTSPSGIPEALVPSIVATMMPVFNDLHKGLVPGSAGGTANFLRADGAWATPAGGPGGGGPTMLAADPAQSVQYNGGSGFAGATGIMVGLGGMLLTVGSGIGPQLSASGVLLPSGALRFGVSGFSTQGQLRGTQKFEMWGRRADDGANLPMARLGAGGLNILTLGGGTEGVAGVDVESTTGQIRSRVGAVTKTTTAEGQLRLEPGIRLGLDQFTHSASSDKLGAWTASGFANIATGITIGASGYQFSVGSGGPELTASGIGMRSGDMHGVRRINGLDGIKVYGNVPGGGAASGTQEIVVASGTAFIVPETVTTGQVYALVPSLAMHADTILLENRTGLSHLVNNAGTGMGVPSFFVATLPPSGGMSFRFGSGAWEVGNRYKLGGG